MCIWPLPSIRREGVDARERAEGGAGDGGDGSVRGLW